MSSHLAANDLSEDDATWALYEPCVRESPDARSIPTLLAAIGQLMAAGREATLNEMALELHHAVYVFESSEHPQVLKVGYATAGVLGRVRSQAYWNETLTVLRTYKVLGGDVSTLEKKFHNEEGMFELRRTVGNRTECFDVEIEFVDRLAENWGLYIYPHRIEVRR